MPCPYRGSRTTIEYTRRLTRRLAQSPRDLPHETQKERQRPRLWGVDVSLGRIGLAQRQRHGRPVPKEGIFSISLSWTRMLFALARRVCCLHTTRKCDNSNYKVGVRGPNTQSKRPGVEFADNSPRRHLIPLRRSFFFPPPWAKCTKTLISFRFSTRREFFEDERGCSLNLEGMRPRR